MTADLHHVLIVQTAGDPRPYIERLRRCGFRFSLIKKRPTAEDRDCFDRIIDRDYQEDLSGALEEARHLHAEEPVHGVSSFSESGVIVASMVAACLGLPGNPPRAALRARNKYLMRQALQQAGLPSPPFHLVRTAEDIQRLLEQHGSSMVIKPISGSSSYGVIRLEPDDPLPGIDAHLEAVRRYIQTYRQQNPQYPFEFWLPPDGEGIPPEDVFDPAEVFLLEGFIGGRQVSVDGLVCDGQATCLGVIEIERIRDADYFLEYEEWMPTRLGPGAEEQIKQTVVRAVQAVGLQCSCFHCELKIGPEGIFVLELAARRGADNIPDFLENVLGVDIYEEGVRLAVGQHRTWPDLPPRGSMKMRYFLPETAGTLMKVEGARAVRQDPRVSELELEFAPGDEILTPPDGFEFLGYLSVFGPTPEAAAAALEELYPQVRFHLARNGSPTQHPVPERQVR